MAEFLDRELRVNEAVDRLTTLLSESRVRVPAPAATKLYTTLPDGRVIDRAGNVVYAPKVDNEASKR